MKNWSLLLALAGLSACAAGPAPRSGFMKDYTGLEKVGKSSSLLEQHPPEDFKLGMYHAIVIEATEVRAEGLSAQDETKLAAAFHDELVEQVGSKLPIVGAVGPGVLQVRSAIISTRKANVALNVATTAVIGAVSRGGVAAEAEVLDGGSGKRIAAISWARRGAKLIQPGLSYTRLGEARQGLRSLAVRLAALFVAEAR